MKKLAAAILAIAAALSASGQTNFSGSFAIVPKWTHSITYGQSYVSENIGQLFAMTNTYGSSNYQMNAFCRQDQIELTNGGSETVSLAAMTNSFGKSTAFSRVNYLAVLSATNNQDDVLVGAAASDQFAGWLGDTSDVVRVKPGGALVLVAPMQAGIVSTNKLLKVAHGGATTNALRFDLFIGGAQ